MGKRYQAILKYLKMPFYRCDLSVDAKMNDDVSGIIIATPTNTHPELVRSFLGYRKPILCEKPICKDVNQLKTLLREVAISKTPFQMMYQYKNLVPKFAKGPSSYDFFRHGNDGLIWDCLQIIGLAKGELELKETSPIWDCQINGHRIHAGQMDQAYITAVESWLHGHGQDMGAVFAAHEKAEAMANAH